MSKELEALERLAMPDELHIKECEKLGISLTEDFDIVEQALLELKAIKEANSNKALECLKKIEKIIEDEYDEGALQCGYLDKEFTIIKQTLLKIQGPKKLLKWEDLKFIYGEWNKLEVYLGNEKLGISYKSDFDFFDNLYEVVKIYNLKTRRCICKIYDKDKQFFNNLHLEVIDNE